MWLCLLQGSLEGRHVGGFGLAHLAGLIALLGFAIAATTLVITPRFAYGTGLLASCLAIPYLIVREMSYSYYGNSWVVFNLPADRLYSPELTYAKLSILSAVLIAISGALSLLRLTPDAWKLRGRSIRSRSWPVFAFSALVVAVWFAHSVTPYRVPTEYGGGSPEIAIVRFEKRGLRSTETRVSVTRDGRLYTSYDIRDPLRYQSQGELFVGSLPSWEKAQHILAFVRSAEFRAQAGLSRSDLPHRWNSDTWYVQGERVPFVIFSSAKNTAPPKELVDWFNEMNSLPKNSSRHFTTRDVCLGFCYEP